MPTLALWKIYLLIGLIRFFAFELYGETDCKISVKSTACLNKENVRAQNFAKIDKYYREHMKVGPENQFHSIM